MRTFLVDQHSRQCQNFRKPHLGHFGPLPSIRELRLKPFVPLQLIDHVLLNGGEGADSTMILEEMPFTSEGGSLQPRALGCQSVKLCNQEGNEVESDCKARANHCRKSNDSQQVPRENVCGIVE